jgi:hypothetical protein
MHLFAINAMNAINEFYGTCAGWKSARLKIPKVGTIIPIMGNSTKSVAKKKPSKPASAKTKPPQKPLTPSGAHELREASANYSVTPTISVSGIADALFTNTQQRVLGLLFGLPDRSFFANEIITRKKFTAC